jgi:hypothetical protein
MRPEEQIHFQISDYLRLQYPKVFFISEASGIRVSMGMSKKLKRMRSSHVHLDIYILYPNKNHHGLILELKAQKIHKKDGELFNNEHLRDQALTIKKLNKLGYKASFATSFNEAKKLIDEYMNDN